MSLRKMSLIINLLLKICWKKMKVKMSLRKSKTSKSEQHEALFWISQTVWMLIFYPFVCDSEFSFMEYRKYHS